MKKFMTGNEAVARGAYEAGVTLASAYPGTPSTEILENTANYKEIYSEWSPNEKVALEVAIGGSIAGARTLAAMKHVGVNVAADPLFTFGYTGVNGGCIIVSADDPGMHSSQNEQDNRYYAKAAKIAMLEPSDSQEAKDYVKIGYEISEKYDVPILLRLTTRICHSKGLVELEDRQDVEMKEYNKNIPKYVAAPANGRVLHSVVEEKLKKLEEYSNKTPLNKIEWNDKKIGIITSGVAYQYAKEVFEDRASYLKLGFTFPIPKQLIKDFAKEVETLYVIEELEPYLETQIKAMGIDVIGKEVIPITGELNPDIIAEAILGEKRETLAKDEDKVVGRPPTMCAGCPHRGLFYELSKKKNIVVTGDIGCYTLGSAPPLSTMDTCICMGSSVSAGHGFAKANEVNGRKDIKVFGVIGDSTFFHSGITGLIDMVYNKGNAATIILDNRITGMTGHQENPGTGYTLMGEVAEQVDIVKICKAIGVKHIEIVNPLKLNEVKAAIDKAMSTDEPIVIITKYPCVLKKSKQDEIDEYGLKRAKCVVDSNACKECKLCLKAGCPAVSFKKGTGAIIDETMCVGCDVCLQICPFDAIKKVGE